MNFLPLCTAIVCPMNSGRMVDRRDQVRTTFFSFLAAISATFLTMCVSANGPFFSERLMSRYSALFVPRRPPRHDIAVRTFVVARLESAGWLAPRSHRVTAARCAAFAASMRMVDRIHRYSAVVRPAPEMPRPARFAKADIFVVQVPYLARSEEHTSELQ